MIDHSNGSHPDIHPDHYRDSATAAERAMRAEFALAKRLGLVADASGDETVIERIEDRVAEIEQRWRADQVWAFAWTYQSNVFDDSSARLGARHLVLLSRGEDIAQGSTSLSPVEARSHDQAHQLTEELSADDHYGRPHLTIQELDTALGSVAPASENIGGAVRNAAIQPSIASGHRSTVSTSIGSGRDRL